MRPFPHPVAACHNAQVHLVVAVNPQSAFGKHGWVGDRVAQALTEAGHEVTLLREASFAELQLSVEQALRGKPDGLIVVGGDGMVSLGVNVLAQSKIPLGIVAAGTGNDMARGLGLPYSKPEASLSELIELLGQQPRTIDLARIESAQGERWYGCVLSAGFDALVNERANRMGWPKGPSRYTIALLLELAGLRTRRYRIEVDGVPREVEAVLIAVGNNSSLGGGMKITPDAKLDDGELDVLIGHRFNRRTLLKVFPRVFAGTHTTHPAVEMLRVKRIRIDTEGLAAYADGERVGPLPVDIEVVPNALRVFAPPTTN